MRRIFVLALLCLPAAARAQSERSNTISPGMTRAQVVAALGGPATQRTAGEFTYMFYPNSCGRACGMNDLVILRHDSVSDAIFRSPSRHYTGTSSSPQQATPEVAPRRAHPASRPMTMPKADSTTAKPAAKPATKAAAKPAPARSAAPAPMKPPATANDAKPSIPAKPPTMQPASAKTTAPAPTKSTTPAKAPAPDKKTG